RPCVLTVRVMVTICGSFSLVLLSPVYNAQGGGRKPGHTKTPRRGGSGGARWTALLVVAARPLVGGVRGLAARRAEGGGLGRDGLEGVAGDRGDKPLLDESLEDRRDRHGTLVAADDLPDGPGGHRTNLPRGPNLGTKCHVLHVGLLGASVPG